MRVVEPVGTAGARTAAASTGGFFVVVAVIAAVAATLSLTAARRAPLMPQELEVVRSGAAGFETGQWEGIGSRPPLPMYLYGLPTYIEHLTSRRSGGAIAPEELAHQARAIAATALVLLVLLVSAFGTEAISPVGGLVCAILAAFLPVGLAYGGVVSSDVPAAAAVFAAAWAIDRMTIRPTPRAAVLVGILTAVAISVKLAGVLLAPIALLLLLAEATSRGGDPAWQRDALVACNIAVLVAYVVLVGVYRGDATLGALRAGLASVATYGASVASLWSRPVSMLAAFFVETPVALQLLATLGLACGVASARAGEWQGRSPEGQGRWLQSRMRMPVVSCVVIGPVVAFTYSGGGLRQTLVVLPFLLVLIAAGAALAGRRWGARGRIAVVVFLVGYAAESCVSFPDYLGFRTLYAGRRPALDAAVTGVNDGWLTRLPDSPRVDHSGRLISPSHSVSSPTNRRGSLRAGET